MRNRLISILKEVKGQALVLVAAGIFAFIGLLSLTVDYGFIKWQNRELQSVADAAALAGAWELPTKSKVDEKATSYVDIYFDGKDMGDLETTITLQNNKKEVKVEVKNKYDRFFGLLFGNEKYKVIKTATAEKIPWSGEALPFINLDDDYRDNEIIQIWEKVTPGDFESIWKDDFEIMNETDPDNLYFNVFYEDGITITKGTVATIKQEVEAVYNQGKVPTYILSLSSDVLESGEVLLKNGIKRPLDELKNKDVIAVNQLVLLACTFDEFDFNNKDGKLKLTVLEEFKIFEGELPYDYVHPDGRVRLIK